MVLGVVAGDALGLTPVAFLAAGRLLRAHDRHLRRGQLAAPRARRRVDVRALRLRRAVELHRGLGDPARLPDRDGDRRGRHLATTWPCSGPSSTRASSRSLIAGLGARLRGGSERARPRAPTALGMVLRLSLLGIVLLAAVAGDRASPRTGTRPRSPTRSTSARRPSGTSCCSPPWSPGVALIGVEAASGLAGEVRVGRRGLRRVVGADRGDRARAVRRASRSPR